MTLLATIIVLGVLIFVHELGHFAAAKAVGVQVQRFSIGLGPKIFGVKRGETEYVLSAIPLGGYVKMGGMDDEVMERLEGGGEAPREPSARDFDAQPIWARTFVISAGVIMNMLFAFGVFTFVAAKWGMGEWSTTRVGHVVAAALPAGTGDLAEIPAGSRFVRFGDSEVHDWGDVRRGFYGSDPGPIEIELAEPRMVIEIRIPGEESDRRDLFSSVLPWAEAGVGAVKPGSPADQAGLEAGDRIVSVSGIPVEHWYEFVRLIEARPGERVELGIVRDGQEIMRPVTLDSEEGRGVDGSVALLGKAGIYPPEGDVVYHSVSLGDAFVFGYGRTVGVTRMILGFLRDLVTGGVSPRSLGSIVMIGQASGQAAAAGMSTFLSFMALFSINLAVLNLLPIPVLDGGHLVFLGIEAVRGGRGLSLKQKLRWSNVGFLVIVAIMLWALSNDFLRLLGI
ncbi:MAG: RIP metalloprotease RseP [Gemmatimonadetes bacterium]|nr:RIP metalloprotease RseP [Gemmatimonadota bacterium]